MAAIASSAAPRSATRPSGKLRLVAKDGHEVDVAISLAPIRDSAGALVGMVAVVLDISKRLAAERQVNLMLRELSHRTKNLMSIVLSIARQTAQRSRNLTHFQEIFAGRVQALSVAQDILVHHNWEGVNVAALVRTQMAPFVAEDDDRLAVDRTGISGSTRVRRKASPWPSMSLPPTPASMALWRGATAGSW